MAGEIIKYDEIQLTILASFPLVNSLRVIECEKLRYFVLPQPKGEADKKFITLIPQHYNLTLFISS